MKEKHAGIKCRQGGHSAHTHTGRSVREICRQLKKYLFSFIAALQHNVWPYENRDVDMGVCITDRRFKTGRYDIVQVLLNESFSATCDSKDSTSIRNFVIKSSFKQFSTVLYTSRSDSVLHWLGYAQYKCQKKEWESTLELIT